MNEELRRLLETLGPGDQTAVTDYVDAVREVERRIQSAEKKRRDLRSARSRTADGHSEPVRRTCQPDVRHAVARVSGRHHARRDVHARPRAELPHLSGDRHHRRPSRAVASWRRRRNKLAKYATLSTYQAQLFAKFLDKLRATADGDGTLLDHSMFLYGAGLSNPNLHAHIDLPLLVARRRPEGRTSSRRIRRDRR